MVNIIIVKFMKWFTVVFAQCAFDRHNKFGVKIAQWNIWSCHHQMHWIVNTILNGISISDLILHCGGSCLLYERCIRTSSLKLQNEIGYLDYNQACAFLKRPAHYLSPIMLKKIPTSDSTSLPMAIKWKSLHVSLCMEWNFIIKGT